MSSRNPSPDDSQPAAQEFRGRGILLDIEGTTSSIDFVYEVMFPYVRQHLEPFLHEQGSDEAVRESLEQIARDAGAESFATWQQDQGDREGDDQATLRRHVLKLMDDDIKSTGLKQLQGLVWRAGFESGEMKAHVYDDVPPALQRWKQAGVEVGIYSSGSIAAQKLFFAHTIYGDLQGSFQGHYDTTTGPKKEPASYRRIAQDFACPVSEIVFVSDVAEELDAAREAGMQTLLCIRPGNREVPANCLHPQTHSFAFDVIR